MTASYTHSKKDNPRCDSVLIEGFSLIELYGGQ